MLEPEKQKFLLSELLAKQRQDKPATEETTSETVNDESDTKSGGEEGVSRFTADELLAKVRKGTKETEAQKYFKVCRDFAHINWFT